MLFTVVGYDVDGIEFGYDSRNQNIAEALHSVNHMKNFAQENKITVDAIYITSYLGPKPETIQVFSKKYEDLQN